MGIEAAIIGSAVLGAGASVYASKKQASAAKRAGAVQAGAARRAEQRLEPFREGGVNALREQMTLLGLDEGGQEAAMNALRESPGYQFRFGEGQRALESSAAARGTLFSGNTGRALTEYGQNFATNELANRLGQLGLLARSGQSAAAGQGAAGIDAGGAIAGGIRGSAQAIASGTEGVVNSANAGIQNALLLNFLKNQPGSAVAT